MTIEIKQPTPTNSWTTSDGKVFQEEELARGHEVFLAVRPRLAAYKNLTAYQYVVELSKHFDFVPKVKA